MMFFRSAVVKRSYLVSQGSDQTARPYLYSRP